MPAHDPTHPSAAPIIIATASVTFAIGITVGALTGYLAPPRPPEAPTRESGSSPTPSAPGVADDTPAVVLVPVTSEQASDRAAMGPSGSALEQPELVAEYAPAWHEDEDDDYERRSAHHESEHDDDDD